MHRVEDADGTVYEAIRRIKPDYFGNGGDRTNKNTPELDICAENGIEPVFGLGGDKYSSSSAINGLQRVEIRWGSYDVIPDLPLFKVKMLNIKAGKKLSLQKHSKLSEFFFTPNGEVRVNLPGVWQAPTAPEDMTIPEAQVGEADENDIEIILEDSKEYEAEVCKKIDLNY